MEPKDELLHLEHDALMFLDFLNSPDSYGVDSDPEGTKKERRKAKITAHIFELFRAAYPGVLPEPLPL